MINKRKTHVKRSRKRHREGERKRHRYRANQMKLLKINFEVKNSSVALRGRKNYHNVPEKKKKSKRFFQTK